jgi:hypothetical protein
VRKAQAGNRLLEPKTEIFHTNNEHYRSVLLASYTVFIYMEQWIGSNRRFLKSIATVIGCE